MGRMEAFWKNQYLLTDHTTEEDTDTVVGGAPINPPEATGYHWLPLATIRLYSHPVYTNISSGGSLISQDYLALQQSCDKATA